MFIATSVCLHVVTASKLMLFDLQTRLMLVKISIPEYSDLKGSLLRVYHINKGNLTGNSS